MALMVADRDEKLHSETLFLVLLHISSNQTCMHLEIEEPMQTARALTMHNG